MAGIDTSKERSIFEYHGRIDRPLPPPGDPLDGLIDALTSDGRPTDGAILDATLNERGRLLQDVGATDRLIDETIALMLAQMSKLAISVAGDIDPGLLRAIRQLGGTDTLTFDLYERALAILRNAQLAALCVDPVALVFAPQGPRGPVIPRTPTRIVTCEEAGNPGLFTPPTETATIDLQAAMEQQKQMTLFRVLLLTWLGLMQFILRSIMDMVNSVRKALKKTIILRPLARLLKPIVRFLQMLICRSERLMYGHPISEFCKTGKPDPTGDDTDQDTDADALSTELNRLDGQVGREPPSGTGCPIVIPPECVEAAQAIVRAVQDWALNSPDTHGNVNPAAFLIHPIVAQMVDLQETGKFMLVSQDQSELTDVLRRTTLGRPDAHNRWNHPFVRAFRDRIPADPVVYTRPTAAGDPMTAPLAQEGCD